MARNSIRVIAMAWGIGAILAISGCTGAAGTSAEPAPTPSQTPTLDPGPIALSNEEAAERYLSIVCPINIAGNALSSAYEAGIDDYLNGGSPDVGGVVAAAATMRDQQRVAIEHLDDTYFAWPELVAAQIPHVRSSYMANMAVISNVASSMTFEAAYNVPAAPQTPEQQAAGQEIRYQLALPADTNLGCDAHADGLTALSTAKDDRDAALATES